MQPGQYTLREQQPAGYLDGIDSPGKVRGRDGRSERWTRSFTAIQLKQGDVGVEYHFGELEASSIAGLVYVDQNGDCLVGPGETGLAGVTIELRSATGQLIATAQTDLQGGIASIGLSQARTRFLSVSRMAISRGANMLAPEREQVLGADLLGVTLGSGQHVVDFNFCEILPSSISGNVWKESECSINGLIQATRRCQV